jgi:DNA-3-methyladenine glycosylase I
LSLIKPNSYCEFAATLEPDNIHKIYHDTQYGFSVESDNELFGRLILEINQAGLSWTTILNKQENFKSAYSNYNIDLIANYGDTEINRLLLNKGIIRNKLKIKAVIYNANKVLEIKNEYESFKSWLDLKSPMNIDQWVKLFKNTFKFTGGEITKEFLMSTGYIKGAHINNCPIYHKINKLNNVS